MTFEKTVKKVGKMALRGGRQALDFANKFNTGVMQASNLAHSRYNQFKKNMAAIDPELSYQAFHLLEASPVGKLVESVTDTIDYATHTTGALLGRVNTVVNAVKDPRQAGFDAANFGFGLPGQVLGAFADTFAKKP